MGEKAMKGKAITKVLSCFLVFAILMSTFSVAALASDSSNSTASNVTDKVNSSVESVALSNNITSLTCRDDLIQININNNKTETVVNESGNSDLPDASNTSSPDIINESDEVPDPDLPVINDTDINTAKTASSTSSCSYVWIKITDKYCYGYKVYVDGVYQFTEGESGTPDGYCCFKVTPGYHTFKLTLNGKEVSKGWNCQCGHVYNWVSMNDMIPHWCERPDQCKNPPTVNFDKPTYYEGDTVHATVSTIYGSVYYKIIDCSGTVRESGYVSNGESISYTIPSGASECCYWKICFYWNEGNPPLGLAEYEGDITTASYECTKCYSFYVCPHETPCKVWVSVEDKYCKGYKVHVDGVYQFTEGESGTPDGYCRFHVTPGTHKFELRKNGCYVSKSWYCQCGTSYRWISMNDMDPHWCECNKPDLVVQDIWWSPSSPKEGDTVTFTVKTKNQGSGNAGGFYVCYYVDGSYYDRDYVSSLSAGSTTTTSFSWTADCGSHSIKAVADCYSDVAESNEGNNARTEYINIVCKPDLITQDIYWSPSNPKEGDTVTFSVKTKNQGSESAGGFYVCYYVDGSYYDRDYVSSLSAGSTTTTSFTWTADCGSHSIKAVADCYSDVEESNEGNNARTEYINIVCKPDLVVQDIFWSPSNPKQGDTVTVNVKTKNQGSESAGGFYVCYYVDGSYYTRDYVSSLSAGSTTTTSFTWTADCGNHAIKAVADCYDAVAESDEENNWRSKGRLNIPCKPDLIVQDISWSPSNPKQGDTVTINVKTKNQGSGNVGGFYVCYYVDGSYYARDYVSSLSAGSTTTTSFTWTAECGNHAIKAVADCYDAVTESDEGNNWRSKGGLNIPCKPDLIVQDISWDKGSPKRDDTITFYVKVKNQGSWSAGTSTVKYYIDGSYVGSDTVPSLSAGSTSTQTFTWKANKCGDVKVKAVADATNAVDESNEGNNRRVETVHIECPPKEKPDLTIQSISVSPPNPKLGDNVEFTVTVKNIGKGTAKKSTTLIYLINEDKQTLLFLYFPSCPPLGPGETHTYTKNAKIEDCGKYGFKAFVDVSKEVDESNEENNRRVKSFTVPCPKEKGTLVVNVYSIDGKPAADVKGTTTIELIKSGEVSPTAKQNIDDKSKVTFTDILAGNYYINVYHDPQLEQGSKEFWGQRKDISITAGTTTTIDFYRYNPYVDKFYAEKNSVEVSTPVKVNVGIKVPSNCPDAEAYVKASVILKDENGDEVYRKESDDRKVQKGGSTTFSFSYTPTKEGTYSGLAKAYIVGGGELCTDNWGWVKVFGTIEGKYNPKVSVPACAPDLELGYVGTTFQLVVNVKNEGNVEDKIKLSTTDSKSWTVSIIPSVVTLSAGKTQDVYVTVVGKEATNNNIIITAKSTGNETKDDQVTLRVLAVDDKPLTLSLFKYDSFYKNTEIILPDWAKLIWEDNIGFDLLVDLKETNLIGKEVPIQLKDTNTDKRVYLTLKLPGFSVHSTNFQVWRDGFKSDVLVKDACWGMSELAVLYYNSQNGKEPALPLPGNCDKTQDIELKMVKQKILRYQKHKLSDWDFLNPFFNQEKRYDRLLEGLDDGKPMILSMYPGNLKHCHAVVAYKVIETSDKAFIYVYDPAIPYYSGSTGHSTWLRSGVYNKTTKSFNYTGDDYTYYKFIPHEATIHE